MLRGRTARSGTEALGEREMQVFMLIGEQLHASVHTVLARAPVVPGMRPQDVAFDPVNYLGDAAAMPESR